MWEATLSTRRVLLAVVVLLAVGLIHFFRRLYHYRSMLHRLPGPPHSWIWGHLPAMYEVVKMQPKHAAPQTFFLPIKETYNLPDYYYLDAWPVSSPILVMFDTDLMNQITVKTSLPKHIEVTNFVKHVGGPGDLVCAEGANWKKWRSAFNPGFSAAHIMTLVPLIVDQCKVFSKLMTENARTNKLFRMERSTTPLTVDIIGKVVLDLDFNTQNGEPNALVDALLDQFRWINSGNQWNPLKLLDFWSSLMLELNTWKMNRYCAKRLEERFATRAGRGKGKAIIDLALESYLKENKGVSGSAAQPQTLDREFKQAAISNLKVFIFAGHDTTSATICYVYYYLSKAPEKLKRARDELDAVFGTDVDRIAEEIQRNPHLLNQLEYMMAIIKETLRMQPPASTLRVAPKGFILRDPATGDAIPVDESFLLFPVDVGYHRLKAHWGDPHVFRPERFLSGETYNKDAWIPFSKGTRSCIGQELAIIETKVILAMTLRSFDFHVAFDELEKLRGDGTKYPNDTAGIQEQFGDPAYQIQLGAAKPREGMPCRLSLRK